MRKMLFLFLFSPLLAPAQRDEYDIAFRKSIPDTLGKPIHLPERDYSDFSYDVVTDRKKRTAVLIIGSDSVYRKFFQKYIYTDDSLRKYKKAGGDAWWYNWMAKHHIDSLPVIDFTKNELLVYAACAQCLAYCPDGPCHRNACGFTEAWYIREKKQARILIPGTGKLLQDFYTDTIPGKNVRWVMLPQVYLSDIRKHVRGNHSFAYSYVVGADSVYYKIFSRHLKDSLPVFDFTKQELVARASCHYCASLGLLNGRPRHRNSCQYSIFWTVRDKNPIRAVQDFQGGL